MTSNGPSKTSGQLHSAKGGAKETVGKIVGSTNLQEKGKIEKATGKTENNAGRGQDYAEGTADRASGKKDQVVGAVSGDRSQEAAGNLRRDKGEAQQDINRHVL